MSRVSSIFFMISLISYYVLKKSKERKKLILDIHIGTGIISGIMMFIALFQSIVYKESIMKYLGFSIIMALIIITGLLRKKDFKYRKSHAITTILFFIYLLTIIVL